MKILLLEDDELLSETIQELLETKGHEVDVTKNSLDADELTIDNNYELYLFDINVEGDINGFQLAEDLRGYGDKTPIIFLTALTDMKSLTRAYDIGIDDYLKKPFEPMELLLRINAKNNKKTNSNNVLNFQINNIEYILKRKEIVINGKSISMGNYEQLILEELIKNKGKTITKDSLLEIMDNNNETALRVILNKIKKKTNINIKNIRGVGYKIEEE